MARKSKRGCSNTETISKAQLIPTAAYARLSVEKETEDALQTQINTIHQFIKEHEELKLVETYCDNGFSGTDFARPGFMRMMEDVYSGKIQCIVVKDLSRFGRDVIDAGNYIENVFPKLGVRFLAITDDFDSSRPEDMSSIAIPVRNMINEMYAMEFSKKQTVYFEQHSRIGDIKYQRIPYGYLVDKERNILIPDTETFSVVQMIFRWFLLGVSMNEIADRLNERKIIPPYWNNHQKCGSKNKVKEFTTRWTHSSVYNIIRNHAYKGFRVFGKKRSTKYKNVKLHRTKEEEWIIHKDTHEALVPAQDFDDIFEMLALRTEMKKENQKKTMQRTGVTTDYFKFKVFCMECGRCMQYVRKTHNADSLRVVNAIYLCYDGLRTGSTQSRRAIGKKYSGSIRKDGTRNDCGKKVQEDFVKIAALDAVQNLLDLFLDRKQMVLRLKNSKNSGRFQVVFREKLALQEKIHSVENKLERLYDDYTSDLLSTEEYLEIKEQYISEQQTAKEKLSFLDEEYRRMERQLDNFLDWCEKLENSSIINRELEQTMIDELIDKIYIGDNFEVEVCFKCADVIEEVQRMMCDE